MLTSGVSVAVQVMPPSAELTVLSVPLLIVRSALVKSLTASENVIVTSEVSPASSELSATAMSLVAAVESTVALVVSAVVVMLPSLSVAMKMTFLLVPSSTPGSRV